MDTFFGDSLVDQSSGLPLKFPGMFTSAEKTCLKNLAVSGAMVQDQAAAVYSHVPNKCNRQFILLGTNDGRVRGWTAPMMDLFSQGMDALTFYLTHHVYEAHSSRWSYSGTWWPTADKIGMYAQAVGAKITGTFDGDALAISYLVADGNAAQCSVKVNGVSVGTLVFAPPTTIGAPLTIQPARFSIAGFGAGPHSFEIEQTVAGNVFIHSISECVPNNVPLYVLTLPYTTIGGTDDARVDAYNARINALASSLVTVLDLNSAIDRRCDMEPADYHLTARGNQKAAAFLLDALA